MDQIIYTNTAKCRDCYRCLRYCPVKAIKVEKSQASIINELCIGCGTCIRECPQKAKKSASDLPAVKEMLEKNLPVAVSVAPSFVSFFEPEQWTKVSSALRKLGFFYVTETSSAAHGVACYSRAYIDENSGRPHIATSCPSVVYYIEKYRPEMTSYLIGAASPMVAAGRMLKEKLGADTKTVFIGPCIAKKQEASRYRTPASIDAVLTFDEVFKWFEAQEIDLNALDAQSFDETGPDTANLFPIEGGFFKTAGYKPDPLSFEHIHTSGIDKLHEVIEYLGKNPNQSVVIEPLFCPHGCINGPAVPDGIDIFTRKRRVLDYYRRSSRTQTPETTGPEPDNIHDENNRRIYDLQFTEDALIVPKFDEQDIKEVLEKTGKLSEEDFLNCGACGYPSCRDQAIAVLTGMAEHEMCIPHMRRIAEQRSDKILETSPSGIIILNNRLNILSMNPAFKKLFKCSDSITGKHISYLMDPEHFEHLVSGQKELIDSVIRFDHYGLICHQILYSLGDEQQFVGLFVNITKSSEDEKKLKELKGKTVKQAAELLEHQINMARKMSIFLGEQTARGEELVDRLMNIVDTDTR